eukprot:3155196-Pleurochrysis_carterae.AAC.3
MVGHFSRFHWYFCVVLRVSNDFTRHRFNNDVPLDARREINDHTSLATPAGQSKVQAMVLVRV